ncbi:RDD family protein [Paeniglutamicibacter sp. MACA_103]|uniref:RDD family protein n=1 Tax=Paeniglutamicibacter sp. MACA_103 TaxID=3377337 RepID=UPI0038957B2D
MDGTMNTVDASAGKRLGAWLLDTAPPVVLSGIFLLVLSPLLLRPATTPGVLVQAALAGTLFALPILGYTGFLWWWEATTGKTVGNLLLKLRTTTVDGSVPGWGPVIRRRLLIILAGVVPVAGPVLVVLSNLFDPHGKRQGWHDKVAGTLVLDIEAGRDPLATGGPAAAESFAPAGDPVAAHAQGMTEHGAPGRGAPAQASPHGGGVITSVPGASRAPSAPQRGPAQEPEAPPEPAPGAASAPGPEAHPDDAFTHTRLRVDLPTVARLVFDDGQVHELAHSLLIGRNPSAVSDEDVPELLRLGDGGRSVSKTHLLVQPSSSGIWVTDRNSTNGSRVVDAAGTERELLPGQPTPAGAGDTVYLGERHFTVELA